MHTRVIKKSKYPALNDKNWLVEEYINKGLNERQIAKSINAKSGGSVLQALAKFDIPIREPRFHRQAGTSLNYPKLNDSGWLKQKYIDEKLSTVEIAKLVPCPNASHVFKALHRHGIPIFSRSEGHLRKREADADGFVLNDLTESVLTGCLLGDGGLKTNHKYSYNPTFHKCNVYYDHIVYVAKLLFKDKYLERISGPIIQNNGISTFRGKSYINHPIFRLSSLTHPEIRSWYEKWYPESNDFKKVIPNDIKIDKIMLLHWFLDDGYSYIAHKTYKLTPQYNRDQCRVCFSTQSFSKDNLEILSQKIFDKFGLQIRPRLHQRNGQTRGTGYEMVLSETQIAEFFNIIGPPPVASLAYKWK